MQLKKYTLKHILGGFLFVLETRIKNKYKERVLKLKTEKKN